MSRRWLLLPAVALAVLPACGDDDGRRRADATGPVTLVVYDSWPADDADEPNGVQAALAEFTADTGIEVDVLVSGDTGTMLSKAALTAGNPEGDVMWGVDNTLLSRAVDAEVFEPYDGDGRRRPRPRADGARARRRGDAGRLRRRVRQLRHRRARRPPASSRRPRSATSPQPEYAQPARGGEPGDVVAGAGVPDGHDRRVRRRTGWEAYWADLRDNGVLVVDGWTEAYYEAFTWAGGDRPLVVSYGSSPPFEVLFAAEPLDAAPTGVVESTCFRQVEFAGVLRGTDAARRRPAARRLPDLRALPARGGAQPVRVPGEPRRRARPGVHAVRHDPRRAR